ncbi:MAG: hypothetical protein OCC45_01905 [Desulfotalea sp.]
MLTVSVSGIHSLFTFSQTLNLFTKISIPEATKQSTLSTLSQQLLYETERLTSSQTAPERRLAYQKTTDKAKAIETIIRTQSNHKNRIVHFNVLQDTIEELNELVTKRIGLNNKTKILLKQLQKVQDRLIDFTKTNSDTSKLAHHIYYENWIVELIDIINESNNIATVEVLYRAKLFGKKIKKKIEKLEILTSHIPNASLLEVKQLQKEIEVVLLGKKGLLQTAQEKNKNS